MMVQLGNGASETECGDSFSGFPSTPLYFLKRKPRRTRVTHWVSGPSSQAGEVSQPFPAKHRLFTRQPLYTKPSEPTDELCDPKKSTVAFPTHQRRARAADT